MLLVMACTDDAKDGDSDSPVDSSSGWDSATDSETGDDSDVEQLVTATYTYSDLATHAPLANATLTFNGEIFTTDAEGALRFQAPAGTHVQVDMELEGYPTFRGYFYQPRVDYTQGQLIPSNATLAQLSGALGITLDPAKAVVLLALFQPTEEGGADFLPGVTVDLDAAYDVPLAFDSNSPYGFSVGNTTLPDVYSNIIFANVTAGAVAPSFDTPDDRPCAFGWSSFEAPAGSFTTSAYTCFPES